jgi:two-component system LytT family response regulator
MMIIKKITMKIRCIAIDDEPLALGLIRKYASSFSDLEMIGTFDDPISGKVFLSQTQVDLLFIDINMPDLTGIELISSLKERPMIIFTTAYRKFAYDGFELDALDYLLKPIDFKRFSRAVEKAIDYHRYRNLKEGQVTGEIFVYSEYRLVKILTKDIEYIESLDDYCKVHISSANPILTLMTLKSVLEKLPPRQFKRIHRSYIVPIAKVLSIQNKKAHLACNKVLPIGNSYIEFIYEWRKADRH